MKLRNKVLLGILLLSVCSITYAQIQNVRVVPMTLSIKSTAIAVDSIADKLPTTALVGRESIAIYNNSASTVTVYVGGSDVTTSNGFPLTSSCPAITIDVDDTVVVYGIVASGTADTRVLEAK